MDDSKLLEKLEMTAFMQVLLHVAEGDTRLSDITRDRYRKDGLASDSMLRTLRTVFGELGLVREESRKEDRKGKPSKFLIITDKGLRVTRAIESVFDAMRP